MQFGIQALLAIIVHIIFLIITWWALQIFRFDVFFKDPSDPRAKVLMILITVVIGSIVGDFFMNYLNWSLQLKYLF